MEQSTTKNAVAYLETLVGILGGDADGYAVALRRWPFLCEKKEPPKNQFKESTTE